MTFTDFSFIFLIMPIVVLINHFIKNIKIKNIFLLIFSCLFYIYCSPKYSFVLFILILLTYISGILIDRYNNHKKIIISIYILVSLIILGYFKYFNFTLSIINDIFKTSYNFKDIILPLGISFYIFESIGYLFDVYNKRINVEKNILNITLFLSFFPTVSSGPILRYDDFNKQLIDRENNIDNISQGLRRFIIGLTKKVLIANQIAIIVSYAFDNINNTTWYIAILGAISYMIQIYMDFSGYSDMAIGIGKVLGFTIKENFNKPYSAISISDFWRRWHISLGSWFKDYIYIPLGGNRCSTLKWLRNIFVVWFLTGLWHGAAYNFIIWGLYFGLLLVIEKLLNDKVLKYINKHIRHLIVLILLLIGWILFRADSLDVAFSYIRQMFNINTNISLIYLKQLDIIYLYPIVILGIFMSMSISSKLYNYMNKKLPYLLDIMLVIMFVIDIVVMLNSSYNAFIYFNF